MQTKTTRMILAITSFVSYLLACIYIPLVRPQHSIISIGLKGADIYAFFGIYLLFLTPFTSFVAIFLQKKPVWFMMLSVGSTVLSVYPLYSISTQLLSVPVYYGGLLLVLIGALSSFFNGLVLPKYMTKNFCKECGNEVLGEPEVCEFCGIRFVSKTLD